MEQRGMQLQDYNSALEALDALKTRKEAPTLLEHVADGPGALRRRAIENLLALGKPGLDAAVRATKSDKETTAEAGVAVLAAIIAADSASTAHRTLAKKNLKSALKHASARVRRQAALAAEPTDLRAIDADDSPSVRAAKFRRLAEISAPVELDPNLLNTKDARLAAAVLDALQSTPPDADIKYFDRHLSAPSRAIRRRAVALLATANEPPLLYLDDPCPMVRSLAAHAQQSPSNTARLSQLLMTEPNAETRKAAVRALGTMPGKEAEQALAKALIDGDPEVRECAQETVQKVDVHSGEAAEEALLARHYITNHQWAECRAIGKAAGPALVEAATQDAVTRRDTTTRLGAIRTLAELGLKASVKPLIKNLKASDGRIRSATLNTLGSLKAKSTISAIRTRLQDVEPSVRSAAFHALADVLQNEATEEVALGLQDPELEVRLATVQALGKCEAIRSLGAALRDPEDTVRIEIMYALGRIGSRTAIDHVVVGLADEARAVRQVAQKIIGQLDWLPVGMPQGVPGSGYARWMTRREWVDDSDDRNVEAILIDGLKHEDPLFRRAALETLERENVTHAIDKIRSCLDDTDPHVRLSAAIALEKLGQAPAIGPAWAAWYVHVGKYDNAAAMGEDAVPHLQARLTHPRSGERVSAIRALSQCQASTAAVAVLSALNDLEPAVRAAGIDALRIQGYEEAIPALAGCLADRDTRVRDAAVTALTSFGESAIVETAAVMETTEAPGRTAALRVFAHVNAPDRISRFRYFAASDANPNARQAALEALVTHLGDDAIPEHLQALGDRSWIVRNAALTYLETSAWKTDQKTLDAAEFAFREHWDAIIELGQSAVPVLMGVLSDSARDPLANRRRSAATRILGLLQADQALDALHRQLWDLFPAVRIASAKAIQQLGNAASAGPLQAGLEHRDVEVVKACANALASIPGDAATTGLLGALENNDADTRSIAATGLRAKEAKKVALPLALALGDVAAVRKAAFESLAALGDRAVGALAKQLDHPLTRVRRDVTQLLSIAPKGAAHLASALQDDDAVVRTRAAQGLQRHGTPKQLSIVLSALRDPNSDVREAAFHAAGALGAEREMLIGGLADANLRVQHLTHELLTQKGTAPTDSEMAAARTASVGKTEFSDPASPRFLAHVLMTARSDARFQSVIAEALHARTEPEVLDALANTLERQGPAGVAAAHALSHPGAAPVWDRIAAVGQSQSRSCRPAALAALASIDPSRGKSAVLEAATHPDPLTRSTALLGLRFVQGKDIIPVLQAGLNDPNSEVRINAATALGERKDAVAAPWLIDLMTDDDEHVANAARVALTALKHVATASLCAALGNAHRSIRRFLAQELGGLTKAVPALIAALQDPDWVVRARAASSLSRTAIPAARVTAVTNALALAAHDLEEGVRAAAITACGALGYNVPQLVGALADRDASTRAAARRALKSVNRQVNSDINAAAKQLANNLSMREAILLGEDGVPVIAHALATTAGLVDQKRQAILSLSHVNSALATQTLIQAIELPERELRLAAVQALRISSIGAEAVERLLQLTEERDEEIHAAALEALGTIEHDQVRTALEVGLRHPSAMVRIGAISAWSSIHDAAPEPLLTNLQHVEPAVREAAANAIGTLRQGADAVPTLLHSLNDPNVSVRAATINSLSQLARSKTARKILFDTLSHGDVEARRAALKVVSQDSAAIPRLCEACADSDVVIRHGAIRALAALQAKEAVPFIIPQVVDNDADVREAALLALAHLEGPADPMFGAMADPASKVRIAASRALRLLGADDIAPELREAASGLVRRQLWHATRQGEPAMALLAHALWTDVTGGLKYRVELAESLAESRHIRAIQSLGDALSDRDPALRTAAANALRHTGGKQVEDKLRIATRDSHADVRAAALLSLATSCPDTSGAVITSALEDPIPNVAYAAAKALGIAHYEPALPALCSLLHSPNESMAIAAAIALGHFGSAARKQLLAALEDERIYVRVAAARGLRGHEKAVKTLTKALRDPASRVRIEAANSIIEPTKESAAALATASASDADASVRNAAVMALNRTTMPIAISAIAAALGDSNPEVRRTALATLPDDDPLQAVPGFIENRRYERIAELGPKAAPALLRAVQAAPGGQTNTD